MLKNVKDTLKGAGCIVMVWVVLSILYMILSNIN